MRERTGRRPRGPADGTWKRTPLPERAPPGRHSASRFAIFPSVASRRTKWIFSAAVVSSAIVIGAASVKSDDVAFLASLFSFGVLLAFTAAQLAVIKLRIDEPELPRPYRAPFSVTIRGSEIPLPAVVGSAATFAIWVIAMLAVLIPASQAAKVEPASTLRSD